MRGLQTFTGFPFLGKVFGLVFGLVFGFDFAQMAYKMQPIADQREAHAG